LLRAPPAARPKEGRRFKFGGGSWLPSSPSSQASRLHQCACFGKCITPLARKIENVGVLETGGYGHPAGVWRSKGPGHRLKRVRAARAATVFWGGVIGRQMMEQGVRGRGRLRARMTGRWGGERMGQGGEVIMSSGDWKVQCRASGPPSPLTAPRLQSMPMGVTNSSKIEPPQILPAPLPIFAESGVEMSPTPPPNSITPPSQFQPRGAMETPKSPPRPKSYHILPRRPLMAAGVG
jgi:hypothetical protein